MLELILFLGGSDDPTPYTVDDYGVTLPAGRFFGFEDVQDANFRDVSGQTVNLHFEQGKSHALAGADYVSWESLGFDPATVCIEWVQLHGFDEHMGEGGQEPVGTGCAVPEPETPPTEKPDPQVYADKMYNCDDNTMTVTEFIADWVFIDGEWVLGEWLLSDSYTVPVDDGTCDVSEPEPTQEPTEDVSEPEPTPVEDRTDGPAAPVQDKELAETGVSWRSAAIAGIVTLTGFVLLLVGGRRGHK